MAGPVTDPRAGVLRQRYHALFADRELPVPVQRIAEDLLGLQVLEGSDLGDVSAAPGRQVASPHATSGFTSSRGLPPQVAPASNPLRRGKVGPVVDDKTISPNDPPPTQTEALARRLLALLPGAEMTRGRYVFELGHDVEGEDGVVVLLTAEAIEFRLPTVEWTAGTHAPVASTRLWRRIEGLDLIDLSDEQLEELLEAAKQARADEWATCRYCGERVPVEHRLDASVCHGCASRHEGVVF